MIQIAGLIHDIGHGPFSHTFERFIKKTRPDIDYNHEEMTIKIFKSMNHGCTKDMENEICEIIEGTHKSFLAHIVHNTINGLDADKLDYFIRDSQCTSFAIGCDWKRIVYESSVKDNEIVFPYKMVGDIFNVYQTRFRLYKELYYHKTVRAIEEMFLKALMLVDNFILFPNSEGKMVSLSHLIDDVKSFLYTQDDIIGQMERCKTDKITGILVSAIINDIKTRKFRFKESDEPRYAHYGMREQNPLKFVKFVNKKNEYQQIDEDIIDCMCPKKFILKV